MQGVPVWSLVRELGSCMPPGRAKKKGGDQSSSRSGWDSTLNSKFTKTFIKNIICIRDMKLILARRTKTQHDYILLLTAVQSLSRVQLFCDPVDCNPLGSLVHGISQQEYWSGLPFLPPGDLPDPRIEHVSLALAGGFFNAEPTGEPINYIYLKVKVAQSCQTPYDPMDCTVHGILQARILEWIAFPFSRGSSQPRDRTQVSHTAGSSFPAECRWSPKIMEWVAYPFSSRSFQPGNWRDNYIYSDINYKGMYAME